MEFLNWLETLSYSIWVRESPSLWAFPALLFVHTLGMSLVAGGSAVNRDRQKTLKSGASYVPSTLKEAKEDFIAQRRGARKKSGRMTFSGTRFRVPPPA